MEIDITLSFRTETPEPHDIDTKSVELQNYHHKLWHNKILPNKKYFTIEKYSKNGRLYFIDRNNEKKYSSDTIFQSFRNFKSYKKITASFADEINQRIKETGTTIGGYLIFPSYKLDNKQTINAARGFNHLIKDRFDLTLECIRRFYEYGDREINPLYETLNRYRDFFDLFIDFKGYIEFFLLDDLVENYKRIKFFIDFKDFKETSPYPRDKQQYSYYLKNMVDFIKKRNSKIKDYLKKK
jgi:hypothetical protein